MANTCQPGEGKSRKKEAWMPWLAGKATDWTGSSGAFFLSVMVVVVWAVTGPIFKYSDTWQLVINTGTTIVTFLMVFLIQRSQNKDSHAIHLKLNELVAAMQGASNRLINVESLTEDEIKTLRAHYCKLVELAKADGSLGESHSVEEAAERYKRKRVTAEGHSPATKNKSANGHAKAGSTS